MKIKGTGYLRIIVPAIILIAVLAYFQYFHRHFLNFLNIEENTDSSENIELHNTNVESAMKIWFLKVWNTLILVLNVHLNKVELILIAILIMNKVS